MSETVGAIVALALVLAIILIGILLVTICDLRGDVRIAVSRGNLWKALCQSKYNKEKDSADWWKE